MKQALLSFLLALIPIVASADAVEIDGIYFNLVKKAKQAKVAKRPSGSGDYSGSMEIPATVVFEGVTYDVTSIGHEAFYFSNITNITIPKSITSIGSSAFAFCYNLSKVNITDLASWCNITFNDYPFYYAKHLFLNGVEIKNLIIPNGVTTIANNAFANLSGINSVIIPNTVTKIGVSAFFGCTGITSVNISDSVVDIDDVAFSGCSSLTSIIIPDNVTHLGTGAFKDCSNLSNVTMSNTLKTIEKRTFYKCTSLAKMDVGNSVTSIGEEAFSGCSSLSNLIISNSVTRIGEKAFMGCHSLTELNIPNSVTDIKSYAFSDCTALTSLSIPNSVNNLEEGTFKNCSGLTSVIIPNSLSTIQTGVFWGCSGLKNIIIPNSVTYIGNYAFSDCTGLDNLTIPNSVTVIGYNTFEGCSGLTSLNIPNSVVSIDTHAFNDCSGLTYVTIGSGVKVIYAKAFANCPELTDIYSYVEKLSDRPNTFYVNEDSPLYTYKKAFEGSYIEHATLHVPETSINSYKEIKPWKDFGKIVGWDGTITSYKLTYLIDDEVYKQYSLNSGSTIIPEPAPTKEGFVFSGWSDLPETMPNHDVTVKGSFSLNTFTLTYTVDGEIYKTYKLASEAIINPEKEPTKEGYTFSGWSGIPKTMPAKDVTVTGTFTINKYNLTYNVDGAEYKSYKTEYGSEITPEAEPTKEGYTFSGWSEIPETMPAHDVTVTGTFTANKYKLTYTIDGKEYKSYEVEYGSTIGKEASPEQEGYTFSGWNEVPETMPAHDVTITGSFTVNTYTLTYMLDGEVYKATNLVYGAAVSPEGELTKEGYTFSGWDDIPETMPAHDVVINGTFSPNTYTLTYQVDGAEFKSYLLDYGTSITPEEEPVKEGYTFSGWSDVPETMPANDVIVTGAFTVNTYKLSYVVDGEEYKAYEIEYGTTVNMENEPTKEGYTFSGWSELLDMMPANDVTITGSFTVNTYTLTNMVDGETYKTYEMDYGTAITPEEDPTKEGHNFTGWSGIPETMPANDVTVTGSFTKGEYKLIYIVDGEVYKTVSYDYEANVTPEAEPTKEGYTFSGWTDIPETMPANDVTITGSFTLNTYKLTYMVDGEAYKTYEIDYDNVITPEEEPTKEGYTFSGWSEIPETMPANDFTITGSFTVNTYTLTYMVDGEAYKTYEIDYGTAITPEEEPTKEGHNFTGWSDIPETMPANDVTVTGSFTKGEYKLTYMVDGEVYKTISYDYEANVTPEAEPAKEGYTFSGWSDIPETMPANDVTITGMFTINKYKLTYSVDGKEYKDFEIEYGTAITAIEEPAKEGYTFSGWSNIPETMPANDVTVTGTFAINTYQVTYMIGGEVFKTDSVQYGATIVVPEATEMEGYTFDGWADVPENMPAHDIIIYGTYTSGIMEVAFNEKDVRIYDIKGRRIPKLQRGVNIIRTRDGRMKKVMVK